MNEAGKQTIGFVGLGIMGRPMSQHLNKAGYPLVVYDIMPAGVKELVDLGAKSAPTSAKAAAAADVVITMVPDSPDVEAAYLGPQGILAGAKPGTIFMDMSSISPTVAIKVAKEAEKKGCEMLDAPVSGGDVGARNATLSIMVGGKQEIFDKVKPIFEVMGKPTYCGPSGSGQVVKACNQILVAVTLVGMAEALVLGSKAGVDPEVIVKVLSGGLARCGVLENRGMRVTKRDFAPGFRSRFHYKDLNIIQEAGRAYQCSLPASALAHELFGTMQAMGWGEDDHSGIVKVIEMLS
ncbi:MAG TPA: 2-hydroxy-3-oxopropionate reductase, partial [Chloroflexota bacterium]|nr:2-hydroxy-3-oxopropionate reductase [Chloroflexota bacterium]